MVQIMKRVAVNGEGSNSGALEHSHDRFPRERCSARKWMLVLLLGLLPLHHYAAQFVELVAEMRFEDWDYLIFRDRINNRPEESMNWSSIFRTNSFVRCVVGLKTWMMEFDSENSRTTYWFTGTNIISHSVITKEIPKGPRMGNPVTRIYDSSDGNPGRPVRVPDIMGIGSIYWLSFCSGSFLQRDGRQIYPPSGF